MNIAKLIEKETSKAAEEVKQGGNVQIIACRIAVKLVNATSANGAERRRLYFKLLDAAEDSLYYIAELEQLRRKQLAALRNN